MPQKDLESLLSHVDPSRRELLKKLFIGTAVAGTAIAAIPAMTTQALAAGGEGEDPTADGKCNDGLVVSKKTGKCAMPKKKKTD